MANWLAARMSGGRLASLLARTQSGAWYTGNRRDDSLCLKQSERSFLPACSHPAELHKARQALTDLGPNGTEFDQSADSLEHAEHVASEPKPYPWLYAGL